MMQFPHPKPAHPAFLQNRLLAQVKSSRSINRFRILHGQPLRVGGAKREAQFCQAANLEQHLVNDSSLQCSKSRIARLSASRTVLALPTPRTHPPVTSKTC